MSKKIILQNMHVVLRPKQYYYLQCKHLCIAMYVELLHKQCFECWFTLKSKHNLADEKQIFDT